MALQYKMQFSSNNTKIQYCGAPCSNTWHYNPEDLPVLGYVLLKYIALQP